MSILFLMKTITPRKIVEIDNHIQEAFQRICRAELDGAFDLFPQLRAIKEALGKVYNKSAELAYKDIVL